MLTVLDFPHIFAYFFSICHRHNIIIIIIIIIIMVIIIIIIITISPLCRVSIHIIPRQTLSLGDRLLQLFCLCCLWYLYF